MTETVLTKTHNKAHKDCTVAWAITVIKAANEYSFRDVPHNSW